MGKVIDFQEWVNKGQQSDFDIKINKSFEELTDKEIRVLLEQMILRQNALIAKLISFGNHVVNIGESQNDIAKRLNDTYKRQGDLIDSHNELIQEVNILINKNN